MGLPYICGKRGPDSFIDVTRPDVDGWCPQGTSGCLAQSENNQICTNWERKYDLCPIIDIKLVTPEEAAESRYK